MSVFSTVTGYLTGKYRGSSKDVAIHQIKAGAKPGTSMSGFAPGLEINPANGENIVYTQIENSNSFIVSIGGTNQNIAPDTARGERRIYSVSEDGTQIKAVAKFKNDGVLELNGATDSAVLFSELETAYDQLKSEVDQLITDINTLKGHGHPVSTTGTAAAQAGATTGITPVVPAQSPSTGDISPAESLDIKIS